MNRDNYKKKIIYTDRYNQSVTTNQMIKILKPYKNFSSINVTQGFHQFHKAIDSLPIRKSGLAYGTPLVAPEKCKIGKIYGNIRTDTNAELTNGYGLFMKGLETGYEHLYWHTQPVMPVNLGDVVERGTIVAYCGNSGNVISGGIYVPIEERLTPNFKGTHLHQVITKDGFPFNPLIAMDTVTEPNYTIFDEIKAITITLGKIVGLLK